METPKLDIENIFSRLIYSNLRQLNVVVAIPYGDQTSTFERYYKVSLRNLICTNLYKFIDGLIYIPDELSNFTDEQKINYFKRHITEKKIIGGDDGISKFSVNKLKCMQPDDEVEIVFFEDNLYNAAFKKALWTILDLKENKKPKEIIDDSDEPQTLNEIRQNKKIDSEKDYNMQIFKRNN